MQSEHIATIREALRGQRKYVNATHLTFDMQRHEKILAIDAALAALDELTPLPPAMPADVRETIVLLLRFAKYGHAEDNSIVARIKKALAYLGDEGGRP